MMMDEQRIEGALVHRDMLAAALECGDAWRESMGVAAHELNILLTRFDDQLSAADRNRIVWLGGCLLRAEVQVDVLVNAEG